MLLNQCLAISLSSNNTSDSNRCDEPRTTTGASSFWRRAQNHDKERTKTTTAKMSINQATAFCAFKQLVDQNSLNSAQANGKTNNNYKLNEVFKRVEFAGFVLPSWLLLSGTYDDLHCIKSHWASGQLRAPLGLRIETIGNIRSVNVDYFGGNGGGDPTMAAHGPRLEPQLEATPNIKPEEFQESAQTILKTIEWLGQSESEKSTGEVNLERVAELINERRSASTVQFAAIERTARALTQTGQLSMRHDPGSSSSWLVSIATSGRNSVSSAKSKSTTLDSGLGGGGSRSSAAACDELLEPGGQLAILEKAPQSASSVLSRLGREPRRSTVARQYQPADDQAESPPLTTSSKRRRGFSLTRSFSFRQQQQQAQRREQETRTINERSAEARRPRAAESQERGGDAATGGSGGRHANANLSCLFRSKSMRAVSVTRRRDGAAADTSAAMTNHMNCDKENFLDLEESSPWSSSASSRFTRSRTRTSGLQVAAGGKSHLRHLSHQQQHTQQATIDYLDVDSNNTHIKRSFSVRRNSLLGGFGKRDELGGGKIAMFLRKLFNIRTQRRDGCEGGGGDEDDEDFAAGRMPQTKPEPAEAGNLTSGVRDNGDNRDHQQQQQSHILVDIRHHHSHTADCPAVTSGNNNNNNNNNNNSSALCKQTSKAGQSECACHTSKGTQRAAAATKTRRRYHDFVASSPSFDEQLGGGDHEGADLVLSSPSQNSLIEILDCSRRLDRSKRDLRQEEARSSSASRATWRLIKRSESNLSQQSNVSCSTNKSTVSQQLRRHLDEAYKRHRKSSCSANKRERDFIDSINVLRQASRHASLENSRSSSKNRRHHHHQHGALNSKAATTASGVRTSEDDESQSSRLDSFTSPDVDWSLSPSSTSGGSGSSSMRKDDENASQQHDNHLLATTDLTMASCCQGDAHHMPGASGPHHNNNHHHHQPHAGPPCACYYCCLSLVNSNSNSPACCPPSISAAQPLPACCMALQQLTAPSSNFDHHHHPHQNQNQLAFHNNNQSPHQLVDVAPPPPPDLGCPIWRSMLMSYCQQQQQQHHGQSSAPFLLPPPPHPFAGGLGLETTAAAVAAAQSQEIVRNLSSALANQQQSLARSPSSQQLAAVHTTTTNQQHQQQQQHNTTIDLKIEIGADLRKLAAAAVEHEQHKQQQQQPARSLTRANRRDQRPASGRRNSSTTEDDDEDATATDSLDERQPTSDSCSSSSSSSAVDNEHSSVVPSKFIITSDNVKLRAATADEPTSDMTTTSCDDDEDDDHLSSGLHTDDSLGANVNSDNCKPTNQGGNPKQQLPSRECRFLAAMD